MLRSIVRYEERYLLRGEYAHGTFALGRHHCTFPILRGAVSLRKRWAVSEGASSGDFFQGNDQIYQIQSHAARKLDSRLLIHALFFRSRVSTRVILLPRKFIIAASFVYTISSSLFCVARIRISHLVLGSYALRKYHRENSKKIKVFLILYWTIDNTQSPRERKRASESERKKERGRERVLK